MKTIYSSVAAVFALCAAQAFSATHTEITKAPRLPFMRGINFDGYFQWRNDPKPRDANTYSNLVAKGFDHIRLPIDFRHFCTYDSNTKTVTFVDTYANGRGGSDSQWASSSKSRPISYIDQAIDLAEQYGMYIYIDGTHGWKDDLYPTDADCTNRFIAIWKAVADRYKNRSNKVIFELMSEQGNDFSGFNTLHRNTIKEIRKVDPTRLILFSSHDGSQPWVLTQAANPPKFTWIGLPQNDNNIAVAVHCYNPGEFTHQGVTWSSGHSATNIPFSNSHRATLNQDLKWCEQWLNGTGVPIVMNEYNVENKVAAKADITEYLSIVTGWCEEHKTPWAPWIYYSGGGMDCFDRYGQLLSYIKPGLFPNLKPTDEYSASDFAHYAEVTFSGYAGSSALANFPVLVKLSERLNGFRYADFQRKDGLDLCFTDANGKLLAHEIDTWNTNGVSTVWVKVPSLTSSTKIVARYGCAKPIVPKVESVWDSDYVAVWHMGEPKLPLADSSNVSRDVTSADGTGIGYGSSGIVGGSVDFGATGAGRCVNADDHANLDGFQKMTIEAWTYQTSRPSGIDKNTGIISKRNSSSSQASYYLYDNGDAQKTSLYVSSSGSSLQAAGNLVPTALNTWNHQVHTFDGSQSSNNAKGYLNGAYQGAGTANVSQIFAGSAELHIGSFQSGDARNFPGKIDEVRISKCVRSADWIKASHDTVAKADFATYAVDGVASPDGPEEPVLLPVEYGPLATNQYAKSMNVLFAGAPSNATLTNFPVLVRLSTAIDGFSYADFRRPNGGDLRFADASGNLLPHEIDTWNPSGVSTVWVKVPLFKKNSYITAHYGFTGSGDPAAVDPKDVWDDDYVGVWHLGESALPLKESSETSSDFESSYGDTINYATNGIVGRAIGFPAGGLYNSIVAPDHDALDGFSKFTVEYWTFQTEHKQDAGILSKRKAYNNDAAYYFYDTRDANSGTWSMPFCIGTNKNTAARWSFNLSQTLGAWNHIVYSADLSSTTKNVHGFKNGTMNGWEPNVTFFGSMPNSAEPLILGNLGANNKDQSFNGSIDEVRISKTVRSKEWVKATYDTIANTDFAVCSFGELDLGESITNLLLKASTDKENPIDYVEGEQIRFDFRLEGVLTLPLEVRAKEPLHVIWTRRADDGVTVMGTNTISLAQGFSVTTKLAIPGIVKMTGTLVGSDYKAFEYYNAKNEKKNITFGGGAGVATEKMKLSTVEPADFDQFWAEAKAKLATVPFNDSNVELVDVTPASLTNQYYIYAAKVPCFGPRPVTGWLTVPRKPNAGGVPIQANFDGYGCVTTAPKVPTYGAGQCVRFAVNAHGYDMIGQNDQYYQDFNDYINKTNRTFNGKTYGYAQAPQDYDNPTNTYFYYMAMRVMRAFDYLKSRPEWDGKTIIAAGGSQGGLQTMWAGGLVEGITKIQPQITWGCDIGCPWNGNGPYPSRTWGIPCVEGAYYFDSALHAKRVPRDCVAEILRLGMGDYTCPPRGVLLSYYNMKCAVSAKLVQGSDHSYIPPQPNQQFTISKAAETDPIPDRILYVNVEGSATTNTLDAALVTEYITNIVKQGAGTLVASAIPNYTGDFTLEGGVFSVGVKNGAGKHGYANTIYVGPGASLEFTGTVGNILDNKKVILDGAAATGAPGKFVTRGGWNKIGDGMSFVLRSDITWAVANGQRASVSNADFDLAGHTLTMAGEGRQSEFDSTTFRNPGHIVVGKRMTIYNESGNFTFQTPSSGSPTVTLGNGATFNVKGVVSASGWTLYATNGNTVCANAVNWPNTVNKGLWDGDLVLGNTAGIARHSGGYGVSNTVFNLKGPVSGSGRLLLGPGWLNLHTADNTYSGSVTVDGQCTNSTVESFRPILPGGGGIGLWNGAKCFPNASSVTFTNTARLAFMDATACTVPNVKFVALAGETQSISGGVYTARSTIAGIVKEGAGTLVVDSPVSVTGLADIQAGTLKVAYTEPLAATQEGVLAKMPQFASLKFASGTALDLSDNVAFVVGDLDGSPSVTNSGLFGITGKWTLNSPTDKLTVTGQNARFGDQVVAGCLAFQGATFEIPSDKDAAFVAAAEANGGKIEVARANWVVSQLDETTVLPMPTASAATNPRWSMEVGQDGQSVMLVLAPTSGYAAWIAGKGITGAAATADKVTNGIANGVRYAFDIDPATSEIGTPIIQVVRDANGNPSVQSRDLATGRDDVTFGILATPDLTDWSNATLVPMKKFATDGLWRPTASESSGYVFPSQMFFKYTVDIQE